MKVSFIILLFCLTANGVVLSQDSERDIRTYYHNQGEWYAHGGIGFLNSGNFNFNLFETSSVGNPSPSLNLSLDYGLTKEIGLGLFLNYYRVEAEEDISVQIADFQDAFSDLLDDPLCFSECVLGIPIGGNCDCNVSGNVKTRVNVFTIGGKLSYHIYRFEKIDTYGSTYLGYSFNRRKTITESALEGLLDEIESDNDVPNIIYFASAGMRYYITPQWAIYGEFGYGNVHLMQLGLTYRI